MSLVSDITMVAYSNENYKLNIVDTTMTSDILVLNFSSNVTLVTAIVTTPRSVSVVVSVTVQGPRSVTVSGI